MGYPPGDGVTPRPRLGCPPRDGYPPVQGWGTPPEMGYPPIQGWGTPPIQGWIGNPPPIQGWIRYPPPPHPRLDQEPPCPRLDQVPPPQMLTDRHLWKQYLPIILRMRTVIKLPPLEIELTTQLSMDYNSNCLTNSANLSVCASVRFSNPYKFMLYWTWNDPSSVQGFSIQQMSGWLGG